MREYSLIHGDCHLKLNALKKNCADLVLTDMPYGTTNCHWDTPLNLPLIWALLKKVAKPNCAILLFAQSPFDKILGASNIKNFRYEWIWEKTNATGFFNANRMPLKAHENILVFYDKLPQYNPQFSKGHKRVVAKRKQLKSDVYNKSFETTKYDSTERYPRSVLKFPTDKQKHNYHPTQKPVALLEYLIRTYSSEGDTVLDFTMGSGSTGEAAIINGRNFIGIEKEKKFFDIAFQRINSSAFTPRLSCNA